MIHVRFFWRDIEDMSSIKEKVHNAFEKRGISTKDVGKALVTFKIMNWVVYGTGLVLCYKYKPLKRLSKTQRMTSLLTKWESYPMYQKSKQFILQKAEKMSKSKFFSRVSSSFGLKSKRFTLALAENTVLYKLTLPITLPLQFVLVASLFKKDSHKGDNRNNNTNNHVSNKM